MVMVAKFAALIIVMLGLSLWVVSVFPSFSEAPALVEVPDDLVATPLPAAERGPVTLEGTVILTKDDTPIPYIEYLEPDGDIRTKQLIREGERGCAPVAGDLPCAGVRTSDYPTLTHGEHIRVTGVIRGDQIFVSSIERR